MGSRSLSKHSARQYDQQRQNHRQIVSPMSVEVLSARLRVFFPDGRNARNKYHRFRELLEADALFGSPSIRISAYRPEQKLINEEAKRVRLLQIR